MSEQFDPYYKWLGIAPKDQPPHHYRLLGIDLFESDIEAIEVAAMAKIRFLREIQDRRYVHQAQRLLQEIAVARLCLLDDTKRMQYDEVLRRRIEKRRRRLAAQVQADGPAAGNPPMAGDTATGDTAAGESDQDGMLPQ